MSTEYRTCGMCTKACTTGTIYCMYEPYAEDLDEHHVCHNGGYSPIVSAEDYRRLAEVARDMYGFIALCRDLPATPGSDAGYRFKERLAACGVGIP